MEFQFATNLPVISAPVPFTAEAKTELTQLQNAHTVVARLEGNAVSRRALLLRQQVGFVLKYGVASISAHAEQRGFTYQGVSLVYHLCAQLLLNIDIEKASEEQRGRLQYEVSQLARALAVLVQRKAEHDSLSDADFVVWYNDQGRISGLSKSYLEAKRAKKAPDTRVGNADLAAIETPDQRMDAMFANPAAFEIEAVGGISSGREGLFVYRQEGDTMRLIPLTADKATIIGLAGYAPCALTGMPDDLRFYREMLLAGAAFVPDEMSDIPIEDVPDGDLPNETYEMLPALGMYLVERDRFSIAHARRDDGLILEVVPTLDLGYSLKGECFIDNLTRRRLDERLVGEADAAQFGLNPVDGSAATLAIEGKTKTLTFTSKADGASINLIVKPRHFRSVWTYRASPMFAPAASATMAPGAVAAFDGSFMKVLLRKQKDRAVTIAVGKKGISFANDKAPAAPFEADVQGTAKVQVMLDDLRRAMVGLLNLSRRGGVTWRLDPKGLLLIEASTDLATYRVFVQTLEPNREQATRSRALRERVESLPKAGQPAANASTAA